MFDFEHTGPLPLLPRSTGEQSLLPHKHRDPATDADRSHSLARCRASKGCRVCGFRLGGSPSVWDEVANQVRHYDVSEYLLDHYVPVRESRIFYLMLAETTERGAGGARLPERRRATGAGPRTSSALRPRRTPKRRTSLSANSTLFSASEAGPSTLEVGPQRRSSRRGKEVVAESAPIRLVPTFSSAERD